MTCADPEGPRLSWLWIAGGAGPDEEGAFEAHLMACDHCFEFHYRTRRAMRILREKKTRFTGEIAPGRSLVRMIRERCAPMKHHPLSDLPGA
jgi:hypothetical protein